MDKCKNFFAFYVCNGDCRYHYSRLADFSLKEGIIPKGNCCGLFSSTYGGGSLLEMELKRDVKLKLEVKDYHGFRFRLDDERSKYDCSVRHVYGVDDSFFGDAVRIVS